VTFGEFAEMVNAGNISSAFPSTQLDRIGPISHECNSGGVKSTLVLRLEEETLWYDSFLVRFGLADTMEIYNAHGNKVFTPNRLAQTANVEDLVGPIIGKTPWPGEKMSGAHHRGSESKLFSMYTKRIAAIVTDKLHEDFVHFQYPLWDGSPHNFRYV